MALSRYVVTNPVRAKLTERAEDWIWSSYRATAGLTVPPPFLNVELTLKMFGDAAAATTRARFIAFIGAATDPTLTDRIRSHDRILGPREFKLSIDDLLNESEDAGTVEVSGSRLTPV